MMAIVCEIGKEPYFKELEITDNSLQAVHEIVGGYVEAQRIFAPEKDTLMVLVNEEGIFTQKPNCQINRDYFRAMFDKDIVYGNFVIVDSKGSELVGVSDDDMAIAHAAFIRG